MHRDRRTYAQAEDRRGHEERDDAEADKHILPDDAAGVSAQAYCEQQVCEIVSHQRDVGRFQRYVRARSAHGNTEKASRIDIGSFVESLAYDYQDTGKAVTVTEKTSGAIVSPDRPRGRISIEIS